MDLRSIINTADGGGDRKPKGPPGPPQQPQQQSQRPLQPQPPPTHYQQSPQRNPPGYPYRDERQPPPMQSPGGRPPSHEYPPAHHMPPHHAQQQQSPTGPNYPQSPYQQPGPYPGRPAPPPLQSTNSFHDPRSPGGPPMPAPSPGAYPRPSPTPTGPPGGATAGYPFPSSHPSQEMTSPVARHQPYPPSGPYPPHQPQRQESYPHGSGPYGPQQHGTVPQTPPIATPGGSHSVIQQRSQSVQSTPTPTSAHSQHYGTPFGHGSPMVATPQGPPNAEYPRQPSQPPTPLGPPMSTVQRQSTGPYPSQQPPHSRDGQPSYGQQHPPTPQQQHQQASAHQQPQSPYQKRMPSAPAPHVVQTQTSPPLASAQRPTHAPLQQQQQSPAPVQRVHESPVAENHIHRLSQHEREHSMSVSPKTRVPSLPSNADRNSFSNAKDADHHRQVQRHSVEAMVIDSDRATTPAKRKLADRDLSPRELENRDVRPAPGDVNGGPTPTKQVTPVPVKQESESPARSKRKTRPPRRDELPIWAKNARILGKSLPKNPNFVLQKRVHSHINGGKPDGVPPKVRSRHNSPEAAKQPPPRTTSQAPPPPLAAPEVAQDLLGAWEPCITGTKPYEEMSRRVADFLFINVINNPDFQTIHSHGIKFEIEAKLGTLVDKDTNHRVERSLASEAVMIDNGRLAFRSSMTEVHHKAFNDFLNKMVIETDPRNPNSGGRRVQVHYKHRREIDRFFELSPEFQKRLPGAMAHLMGRKTARVRITYDQKSREILAKIIKARVANLDLHLPTCQMDCRISVNLEMDWDGPVEELEQMAAVRQTERQPDRNKDRLSYTHGHYQIDLTQVTQQSSGPGGQRMDKEHELEIELAPEILIDQGRRAAENAPHRYQELIEGFVDNVRLLARMADG